MFRDALVFAGGAIVSVAGLALYGWITKPAPKDMRQDLKDHMKFCSKQLLDQIDSPAPARDFINLSDYLEDVAGEAVAEVKADWIVIA